MNPAVFPGRQKQIEFWIYPGNASGIDYMPLALCLRTDYAPITHPLTTGR